MLPFWASEWWTPDSPPRPREFMVDGWIARGSAALLAGEGGTGKSLLGQMMCSCVALGRDFMGAKTIQSHAAYMTCEDDENELHHRQLAINRALGVKMSDYGDNLTIYSRKGLLDHFLGVFNERGAIEPTSLFEEVLTPFGGIGAAFVVVDNATHVFAGNEIVRREVAAFCNLLDRAAIQINGSVVLIAHTAKTAGSEYSGSTGWDGHVRQRLFLSHSDGQDPDERILKRSKSNYARRGEELRFRWHEGAFVADMDLPHDRRAELAIVARDAADNDLFLTCLIEGLLNQMFPVAGAGAGGMGGMGGAAMGAAGMIGSVLGTYLGKGIVDLFGGLFANGGAFGTAQKFANGGAFTNSIVNDPTLFRFADGGGFGKVGLMGEAGPEAVMPLMRDGSGKLGVQANGGGGGRTITIGDVVQHIKIDGGFTPETAVAMIRSGGEQILNQVRRDLESMIQQLDTDGTLV